MQKIDGTTIKLNRGDSLNLTLSLSSEDGTPYTFRESDEIIFSVYNKNRMSENAKILKTIKVEEASETVEINCTSEETKIDDLINKPIEYWYEIELNGEYTVIGYDENGPKLLILYPEGSKVV